MIVDALEGIYEFAQGFNGCFMTPDGRWPLNWRRYVHGLRFLGRDLARTSLAQFKLQSMAQHGKKEDVEAWHARQTILAGWKKV